MYKLLLIGILSICIGCNNKRIDIALSFAGENIVEIEKVLTHYSLDSTKYEAATFMIENMPYHNSLTGSVIEAFRDSVNNWDRDKSLNDIYKNILYKKGNLEMNYNSDIRKVTSDFIIDDINCAFEIWEKSLWKDSISFNMFKEYILPYSVSTNQPLVAWRQSLHDSYYPMIEGVKSPKEAFDIIYNYIIKEFKHIGILKPSYIADPLIANEVMMGNCDMRTMLIVSVARSLCIPSAYDYVSYWANCSSMGHSWAVFIDNNEQAYFFSKYDTKSYNSGAIDASYFPSDLDYKDDNLPFTVDSIKKVSKVMRYIYKANLSNNIIDNDCPNFLKRRDYKDVSAYYGLNNKIDIEVHKSRNKNVYLCNFVTSKNWTPIWASKQVGKSVVFDNVGKDIVYLLAQIKDNNITPLSNPMIVDSNNHVRILNPNMTKLETISLYRKYIVFTRWLPNRWSKNIGVSIEASNDPEFITKDTLYLIDKMPVGITDVDIDNKKAYRYLRVAPPHRIKLRMAEVSFYEINDNGEEKEITGELIHHNISAENAQRLFDKDYLTEVDSEESYYWVGYDLGEDNKKVVSRISYCPWNDGNFIEIGDRYELFYYNMKWISLGEKIADKNFISFENVPSNALLWLRNLTKGNEERVFTYEDGKQVWW